jgi:hypothetical protein
LIGLASRRLNTLDVVQRVSLAGQGGVTPPILLERVSVAVAEAFDFESVVGLRYDADAEEVTEIAFAGTFRPTAQTTSQSRASPCSWRPETSGSWSSAPPEH